MRGTNPIRPPVMDDGQILAVKEIFATLQGEGPRAGQPAVFLRLGGCNLACDFCDTAFEDFREMALTHIVDQINSLAASGEGSRLRQLVVITGGEPFRQNIVPLSEALIAKGFIVQIETNGTLFRQLPDQVEIVCSPKNSGTGYAVVRDDVLARACALKFIVSASHTLYQEVGNVGQQKYQTPVYVQPMDEYDLRKNAANLAHAVQLASEHGYHLSLQLHKIAGVP